MHLTFFKKMLNWRMNNSELIAKGSLKHFPPQHGVYVYQRELKGRSIVVMLNGNDRVQSIDLSFFKEVLPKSSAENIIDGRRINLNKKLTLDRRDIVILTF
jgi:Cyclo-malto-dextrinase C-terminal domain.